MGPAAAAVPAPHTAMLDQHHHHHQQQQQQQQQIPQLRTGYDLTAHAASPPPAHGKEEANACEEGCVVSKARPLLPIIYAMLLGQVSHASVLTILDATCASACAAHGRPWTEAVTRCDWYW